MLTLMHSYDLREVNRMMLSDFVITLLKEWQIEDLPVNILIGENYYGIKEFFFDEAIHEYVLELSKGSNYKTHADIVDLRK